MDSRNGQRQSQANAATNEKGRPGLEPASAASAASAGMPHHFAFFVPCPAALLAALLAATPRAPSPSVPGSRPDREIIFFPRRELQSNQTAEERALVQQAKAAGQPRLAAADPAAPLPSGGQVSRWPPPQQPFHLLLLLFSAQNKRLYGRREQFYRGVLYHARNRRPGRKRGAGLTRADAG